MHLVAKLIGGLFALLLVALGGASVWFWFYPVTVNNAVNQFSAELTRGACRSSSHHRHTPCRDAQLH